jgi:tetratricopeptide (TPR) repeat protein
MSPHPDDPPSDAPDRALANARALQQQALDALQAHRPEVAERCYRHLLAIYPHPGVAHNLGMVLVALRRDAEAVPLFEQALAARPASSNSRVALANALLHCDRPDEALACCESILDVDPGNRDARHNKAIALRALNRNAEAAVALQTLLADDPTDADAELSLALALLTLGRYEHAWAHYEARWRGPAAQPPLPPAPPALWRTGENLNRRVVVVQAEQGLGDTLQFLQFLPRLDRMCARADLQVPPELVALCRRNWPSRRIDALGTTVAADVETRIPLLSLPLVLGLEDPGAASAYLHADPARAVEWRQQLGLDSTGCLGIAWRGDPGYRYDAYRSMPVQTLRPWFEATAAAGWQVVAVQRDVNTPERSWLQQFAHVRVPGMALRDFEDTAAVMASVVQMVCVDTSVIHLAGALGRPGVVLLRASAEWRWGIDRPDGATYCSVRTLRQPTRGDWGAVVQALIALLP